MEQGLFHVVKHGSSFILVLEGPLNLVALGLPVVGILNTRNSNSASHRAVLGLRHAHRGNTYRQLLFSDLVRELVVVPGQARWRGIDAAPCFLNRTSKDSHAPRHSCKGGKNGAYLSSTCTRQGPMGRTRRLFGQCLDEVVHDVVLPLSLRELIRRWHAGIALGSLLAVLDRLGVHVA